MEIKIRKSKLSDLKTIQKMNKLLFDYEQKFGDTFNPNWTYSEIGNQYFTDRITSESGIVFLAEFGGDTVGYICGYIDHYSFRLCNPICEIENMFVLEEYRYNGLGKRLVKTLSKQAKAMGANHIKVGVLFNNSEALAFYKKLGLSEFEIILEGNH